MAKGLTKRVTTVGPRKRKIPVNLPRIRTGEEPSWRPTGWNTLNKREAELARALKAGWESVPDEVRVRAVTSMAGFASAVIDSWAQVLPDLEDVLWAQADQGGAVAFRELQGEVLTSLTKQDEIPPEEAVLALEWDDLPNPGALDYAQREAAQLVTNMASAEQETIREVIEMAYTEEQTWRTGRTTVGLTRRQTSAKLLEVLEEVTPTDRAGKLLAEELSVRSGGLTTRQGQALLRRMAEEASALDARGITGQKALDQVRRNADNYAEKLRKARSRTIARTEIMKANNAGRLHGMEEARKAGLFDPKTAQRQWVTGPTDVCNICEPLNGEVVSYKEPFSVGVLYPPAHPNCRCTHRLIMDPKKAPISTGTGSFRFPRVDGGSLVKPKTPKRTPASKRPTSRPRTPEPPPARPRPSGTPVSDALPGKDPNRNLLAPRRVKDEMDEVVQLIDSVHGDGDLPLLPAFKASAAKKMQGGYAYRPADGRAAHIQISKNASTPRLTMAHEVGHFIDHQGIGSQKGSYATNQWARAKWRAGPQKGKPTGQPFPKDVPEELGEWWDAANESKSIKSLRGSNKYRGHEDYLLQPEEVWARSYAQFIAEESGDPGMLAEIAKVTKPGGFSDSHGYFIVEEAQWTPEDFAPIRAAMRKFFQASGWMTEG
jgi:SPP1 gp7 family putative phage head morphogenesis protein